MRRKLILVVAAIVLYATPLLAMDLARCGYMVAIPREEKPDDLPDIGDFEGVPWSQRPFLPAPERPDLCMDAYLPSGTQVILMEEEIEGHIKIAKLNWNNATAVPTIVEPLMSGSFAMLGPEIVREGDSWYLVITQRQDYETPRMRFYMMEVSVPGETLAPVVTLQIVNIDDNPPIISLTQCIIPEMSATGLTNCVFNVSDLDGKLSTYSMKFRIDSDRAGDRMFYLEGQNIENEWYWMNMIVGITSPLNFEDNPLHIFPVTALDSLPNTHTVTLMVQVQNVEHRPPRWIEIFAVQQFDEKTFQNFTVRAIDRDTGINKSLSYYLETAPEDTFFSIETIGEGHEGAILFVEPIDRDTLMRDVFRLDIVAHKYDNVSLATAASVVIIVNDVNDQTPNPLHPEYRISIPEETAITLNFEEEFGFHDRDLGENAQYEVRLESVHPPGVAEAFYIAPDIGYQRQTFIMGTLNHSMLDYENPPFQNITIKVVATDLNRTDFVNETLVHIALENWNDELPIFEHDVVTARFNETEGAGFFVATVRAHDRDIGDRVVHSLMGNAGQFLSIDDETGDVTVSVDDAFDYHRQNQLFIQVRADDTLMPPFHTATAQLVIELIDVNNVPPTLRLPRGSPEIEENVPALTLISREIRATDPDTTAHLRFDIDWDSSYATKQGRVTDPREYHGCAEIETVFPDPERKGTAFGHLVVQEVRPNVTLDFEMFEVLYLTIRVTDLNTVYGEKFDELTFTVIIIDMNDNPPIFAEGSLEQAFRVREHSAAGTIVGSVLATDIDGPLYNQVRYTILPRNNTPDDLMDIDFVSGQLTVAAGAAIDADVPPREFLYYTVVASDCCSLPKDQCPPDPTCFDTPGEIAIYIQDTNNKVPYSIYTEEFDGVVYLLENATAGTEIVQLLSNDLDRDVIYHTVSYQINFAVSPRLRNFFEVDLDTGVIRVEFTTNEVLDRDGDEPTHRIFLNLIDNFYSAGVGNRNLNTTEVLVVLLDVNDNAPELPPNLTWNVSEDLEEGVRILPEIYAPDRDEPDTDNSRVFYRITGLALTNRELTPPDLFTMVNIANVTGELETAMPLRGYWGTYNIGIRACDHGHPQMCSEEEYELVVRPFNYHAPQFVFPREGTTIRLSWERAVANGVLVLVNGEFLERVSATDEDGLEAGVVTFEVVGDDDALDHFQIIHDGDNHGTLVLRKTFTEQIREFSVTIRATDGGTEPHARHTDATLTLVYVPTQGEPRFAQTTAAVTFTEKEEGLTQQQQLPLATDPKNHRCEDDCHQIYYMIIDGDPDGHFAVEPTTNELSVVRALDRNASATHALRVAAGNAPGAAAASSGSILTVTVTVREAFPRPTFERRLYTAGISTLDSINRELLTVRATHTDDVAIRYTLDQSSMVVDPSLEAVREVAFALDAQSGLLTLTMQPTSAMHGMFEFNVVATDPAGANDTAEVKVYLISSQNRVFFRFLNTLQEVEDGREFIASTFSLAFRMTCNIDAVAPAADAAGAPLARVTEVRAHFIQDDVPVPTQVIERLRSDLPLLRYIQDTLQSQSLVLDDLLTDMSPAPDSRSDVPLHVLAGLTALLAFLCLVFLLAYFIRTRVLQNRLDALLSTKYGSRESGLNRAGLAAPGTNKHATEGSNPIWNEALKAPDFDAISDTSDDSDLIGIEDMAQFRSDYFPPEDTNSLQNIINPQDEPVAHSKNNFNFNATPFSPEFANRPFNRWN